jgi:hypothetical protein
MPGWGDGLIFVPYGNVSSTIVVGLSNLPFQGERRRHRRLFAQVINEKQNDRFLSIIETARNRLLNDLLETPEEWLKHIKL